MKSFRTKLKIGLTIVSLPFIAVGILMAFLPAYLATHDVKWIIFAGIYVCLIIFLGLVAYKYMTKGKSV